MYSMVLMMAVSTTPDSTAFGGGYGGCSGSSCHGCNGSSCNGCSGSSCHGNSCHGGGGFLGMKKRGGLFGGFLGGKHKSNGCSGSSCHGCSGSSCHGGEAHGCTGGMMMPAEMHMAPPAMETHMAPPAMEMHMAPPAMEMHHAPSIGCGSAPLAPVHGAPIIHSTPIHGEPVHGTPIQGSTPMSGEIKKMPELKKEEPKVEPKKEEPKADPKKSTMAPAKIELTVPQGAKVLVNGLEVAGNADLRYFQTRNLSTQSTETYVVSVEVVRNGKTLTASEKLLVKGGETTSVTVVPQENTLARK